MQSRFDSLISKIRKFLVIPRDNPELVQAELAAFSRQMPLMYAIIMFNLMALAVTYHGAAPRVLTVHFPAVFETICCIRMVGWWRSRGQRLSFDQAIRKLRTVIVLSGLLGAGFSAWGFALFPYGDAYAQGHVAFLMAITVIGCGFCLMHLRTAALLVMLLVAVPFAIFFGFSGNPVFVSLAINMVLVTAGFIFLLFINFEGFEQQVNAEKALRSKQVELQVLSDLNLKNSHTDSLTGLPNRRHFFAELEKRIVAAAAAHDTFAIGILDLDGFKPVNDVYGHRTGDLLLADVGRRLRAHLDPSVFVARLGGDEFVVISQSNAATTNLPAVDDIVRDALSLPFQLQDLTVRVGCSIGFARFPSAAETAEELFVRADYALYFAKQHDRGNVVVFSTEHEATIRQASAVAQALADADLERELWIAYQPIIDTATSQPIGFEALARWRSPKLGNVPPNSFIVAAEQSGRISQLTPILLRKALQGAAGWPEHLRISFNLSAIDVGSALSILQIMTIVEQSGFDPRRIDFEITETAVMRNFAQASEAISALKGLGAKIALDDFGTGYSSLSCIRELPLDKIKIDGSFIANIESDPAARLILRTMLGLCNNLHLDCVVEGVETQGQMDILSDEHCRFMQGYLFARPISADDVPDYIARAQLREAEVRAKETRRAGAGER